MRCEMRAIFDRSTNLSSGGYQLGQAGFEPRQGLALKAASNLAQDEDESGRLGGIDLAAQRGLVEPAHFPPHAAQAAELRPVGGMAFRFFVVLQCGTSKLRPENQAFSASKSPDAGFCLGFAFGQ